MRRVDAKVQNEDSFRTKGLKIVFFNEIKTELKQLQRKNIFGFQWQLFWDKESK